MRGFYLSNKRKRSRLKTRVLYLFSRNVHGNRKVKNWLLPGSVAAVVIAAIVCGIIFLPRAFRSTDNPAPIIQNTSPAPSPAPTFTPRVPWDRSDRNHKIDTTHTQIGFPAVYRQGVAFAAGTGSPDQPVLKTLYYYDTLTNQTQKIATSQIKYGEITEVCIGSEWIVWVDTDWNGNHTLYKYNRETKATEPIQECKNNVPKLRLHGDWLVWMEQSEKNLDKLHLLSLESGEDLILYEFTDAHYGMSAPCLYDDYLVFAGPNEKEPTNPNLSSIYTVNLNQSSDGELTPTLYTPGGYVHEPVSNGEALAWIDTNKSPLAKLYVKYGDEAPRLIQQGVTSYAIGDDYIVYNYRKVVYAYFYKTDTLARLSEPGIESSLPISNENTIVWYDESNDDKDILKYTIME